MSSLPLSPISIHVNVCMYILHGCLNTSTAGSIYGEFCANKATI